MELVTLGVHMMQSAAELAASYKVGQVVLKQLDRTLWVFEKTAKWALPPPLEHDKPPPELVRPLPWFLFLPLLVALRVTREVLSLFNLMLGKPTVRSVDVVLFIQSKRRYIRTLKYQGSRAVRARHARGGVTGGGGGGGQWPARLTDMLLCYRRAAAAARDNAADTDHLMVVKKKSSKASSEDNATASASASASAETPMERIIEKMMGNFDADCSDDSSYTLTNVISGKNYSDNTESDQEAMGLEPTPALPPPSSTPKRNSQDNTDHHSASKIPTPITARHEDSHNTSDTSTSSQEHKTRDKMEKNGNDSNAIDLNNPETKDESSYFEVDKELIDTSAKKASINLINKEKSTSKKTTRLANGRTIEMSGKGKDISRQSPKTNFTK